MEIVSADKGGRWSVALNAVEARFDFFPPAHDSEVLFGLLRACLILFELFCQVNMATWCGIICLVRICFLSFSRVMSCRVVVSGELSSPLLSSFSSTRLITWHSTRNQVTPLDGCFGFFIPASKCQPSFHSTWCAATELFLPLFLSPASNRPVVVAGKLSNMGNVVCRSSLLVSLRALTIHNGTLAVTVTWRCHLVLHTSPSANSCWQFQGCVWQECSCAMVWRHFLKPT